MRARERTRTYDETRVGLCPDVVLGHELDERLLGRPDVRVEEDLVDDRLDLGILEEHLEVVNLKVGHSDRLDQPVGLWKRDAIRTVA